MTKEQFNSLKRGATIKIPGEPGTLVKARVWFEDEYQDALYDGKKTIYDIDYIPDDAKITESELLYVPQATDFERFPDVDEWCKAMDENEQRLRDIDDKQKEAGKMIYRYLKFPYADSYALYQITEVRSTKVRVMLVTGVGDDWELPEIPDGFLIDKSIAEQNIANRDRWSELFKKKAN